MIRHVTFGYLISMMSSCQVLLRLTFLYKPYTLTPECTTLFAYQNVDQISESTADILLLPLPKSKRSPYWNSTSGVLVSILTSSPSSACDSALAYQILSQFDDRRRSYDVISILQDGGHTVANLLSVSGLAMSDIQEDPKLFAYQISTRYLNPRSRYYYFRFLKTNSHRLWPVVCHRHVILHWPTKCCANWMIADGVMMSYRLHDGGHSFVNLLPVWPRLTFKKVQSYRHTKFRPDISVHGRDITTSGFWKQTAAMLKFHFRFRLLPFHSHRHVVFHRRKNFIAIGSSAAEL